MEMHRPRGRKFRLILLNFRNNPDGMGRVTHYPALYTVPPPPLCSAAWPPAPFLYYSIYPSSPPLRQQVTFHPFPLLHYYWFFSDAIAPSSSTRYHLSFPQYISTEHSASLKQHHCLLQYTSPHLPSTSFPLRQHPLSPSLNTTIFLLSTTSATISFPVHQKDFPHLTVTHPSATKCLFLFSYRVVRRGKDVGHGGG